ncbi:MAG: hypothetical protein HQ513_19365 [Rhodospirillales bacterium]|nr:hypothetical protein [Rhodospirillales bacterium]
MALILDRPEMEKMTENKSPKTQNRAGENAGRHAKRAEERRQRQAEALRANLKKRKQQIRDRDTPASRDQ